MTELTIHFNSAKRIDVAYFATAMKEFHNWDAKMRVIGGVVMTTESDAMTALQALIKEGFDLDNDFEKIAIAMK
jgi:hypothetical protein